MTNNAFGPRWQVEKLDAQVLRSLAMAVLKAKLDAEANINDLRGLDDNVYVEHVRYWQGEHDRLTVGHAWLLELLAQS